MYYKEIETKSQSRLLLMHILEKEFFRPQIMIESL